MKLRTEQLLTFTTIFDLLQRLKLPSQQHPLVAMVNYDKIKPDLRDAGKLFLMEFYKISFKLTYKGLLPYGQGKYDFKDGGLAFLAPNQAVKMSADPDQYEGYVLYFHPDLMLRYPLANSIHRYGFFSYAVNEALCLSDQEKQVIVKIFESISEELSNRIDAFSQDILISLLELLLQHSNRFYIRQFITRKVVHHDLIDRLQSYLSSHLNRDMGCTPGLPTARDVAEHLMVSPRYLSDMLKALTGNTTQQHIHLRVVERAKELLAFSSLTTSEIAYYLGFEHPQSFNRFFKLKTTISPLTYRRSSN